MKRALPGALQVVRGLLFVFAGLTVILFDPDMLASENIVTSLGVVTWVLSGGLSLMCAIQLPRGTILLYWGIITSQIFLIVVGTGWMAGVWPYQPIPVVLVLPVLGLLCLSSSRHFFRERIPTY